MQLLGEHTKKQPPSELMLVSLLLPAAKQPALPHVLLLPKMWSCAAILPQNHICVDFTDPIIVVCLGIPICAIKTSCKVQPLFHP